MRSPYWPIDSKAKFVRLYQEGVFGNAAPTWDTLEDWLNDWYPRLTNEVSQRFHIRNRITGAKTWYTVAAQNVPYVWGEVAIEQCGFKARDLYISAMAPTLLTIIQGEVQRGLWGLDLYYSTCCVPMREALVLDGKHCSGIQAQAILQATMNQQSYEWLQYLLETYEDHVVEFSVYDCEWGTVHGHNTVFWEVRYGY